MRNCNGIGFSEVVRCGIEDDHRIAHGWTQSTGQSPGYPYTLPDGWMFDPKYPDVGGGMGSHGGCAGSIMTLVHLREIAETSSPQPMRKIIVVALAILAAYLVLR